MRTFYQPERLGAELEDLYSWLSTDSGDVNSRYSAGNPWVQYSRLHGVIKVPGP
jgi:hypothetical protein